MRAGAMDGWVIIEGPLGPGELNLDRAHHLTDHVCHRHHHPPRHRLRRLCRLPPAACIRGISAGVNQVGVDAAESLRAGVICLHFKAQHNITEYRRIHEQSIINRIGFIRVSLRMIREIQAGILKSTVRAAMRFP